MYLFNQTIDPTIREKYLSVKGKLDKINRNLYNTVERYNKLNRKRDKLQEELQAIVFARGLYQPDNGRKKK